MYYNIILICSNPLDLQWVFAGIYCMGAFLLILAYIYTTKEYYNKRLCYHTIDVYIGSNYN